MNKNKLYGTFCPIQELAEKLLEIKQSHSLPEKKIFELKLINKDEILLVYNVAVMDYVHDKPKNNSLVLHRNQTCLYSINSINLLVAQTGEYKIDWDKYKNTLLTTQRGELSIVKTELNKIHYIQ